MEKTESKKAVKCKWCKNQATQKDYREIDGITSKINSCNSCLNISTKTLLNRKNV